VKTFISDDPNKTESAGRLLAEVIQDEKKIINRPFVVALVGDLGTGKTTFVRGFLKEFGVCGRITSPTFIIYRRFPIRKGNRAAHQKLKNIFHIDAYRLKKKEVVTEILMNQMTDSKNIFIIEWADRIKKIIPKTAVWVTIRHGKTLNERIIVINSKLGV